MAEKKLSVSDRNGRYLLVFSFVSVVLVALSKSMSMLENELSKVYVSQSNIPYIKMSQTIPSLIFVSCFFLLVVLIRYIYFEASVFIDHADNDVQKQIVEKADKSYKHILYYLMMFGINLGIFFLCSAISEIPEISKNNYAVTYSIIIVMSSTISIIFTRKKNRKIDSDIPHISTDCVGAVVFFIFCLCALTIFWPQQKGANLKIQYEKQYININLEGSFTFERIQILVNDELAKNIEGSKEKFFVSRYIAKDTSANMANENLEADIFVEQNSDYFYYAKTVDISDYISEGSNDVHIYLEISGRTYLFSNPLIVSNSNYKYMKPDYESDISIKK